MTHPHSSGRVLDAGALKALAHPLRFQIVELLMEHGPSTASELGRLVGESSGLTSYHLRQLAEHELIEEAPELGTGRDRWWKAIKGGYTIEGFEMLQREQTRDDAQFLLDEVLQARFQRLRRWHRHAPIWGRAWAGSTIEMTARLRLTQEELREMGEELVAVVDRYRDMQNARRDGGAEPDGVEPVTIHLDSFPSGDPPEQEGSSGVPAAADGS